MNRADLFYSMPSTSIAFLAGSRPVKCALSTTETGNSRNMDAKVATKETQATDDLLDETNVEDWKRMKQ